MIWGYASTKRLGTPGLVVKADDSCPRGGGFKTPTLTEW